MRKSVWMRARAVCFVSCAIVSALLCLTLMPIVAEADWVASDGGYRYLDQNGNPVTDDWVESGGHYYYLGKDGNPLADEWLTYDGEHYYFGSDGRMLADTSIKYRDGDYEGWEFFFDGTGKCYRMELNGEPMEAEGLGNAVVGNYPWDTLKLLLAVLGTAALTALIFVLDAKCSKRKRVADDGPQEVAHSVSISDSRTPAFAKNATPRGYDYGYDGTFFGKFNSPYYWSVVAQIESSYSNNQPY